MKKVFGIVLGILTVWLFVSCEQPTMLSVSQTALSFENGGGNQSVTLTANKVWTASSNQGWLRVSPSSGEGNAALSVSCEGNSTYDTRTGTITIVSEELTQTISVTQTEGQGLLISQSEYNLSNEAQTIDVTVQANVQYAVDIDNACRDWIKQESTKGLSSNTIKFAISKNESYDSREGKITIRQTNGSLSATVIVKQSQTNGLFADKTEYEVSYEEQQLNIKVKANVNYDVQIDDSCKDWISRVGTKGLTESTVTLAIAMNEDLEREGKVVFKYGSIQETVVIKQAGGFVVFGDANFKAYCLENFDRNSDGYISFREAAEVSEIEVCTDAIASLHGIEFFTNLSSLSCTGTQRYSEEELRYVYDGQLTALDVSKNTALTELKCFGNRLTSLDVSKNTKLTTLTCANNQLPNLDVSKNTELTNLGCGGNQLPNLDVSKNTELTNLGCGGNHLPNLDVSKNTKLTTLTCANNQLPNLDVSKNTELTYLSCSGTQLTNLDVSKNTALKELYCDNCQLMALDLSKNTALIEVSCDYNQLTELQVSKNNILKRLSCDFNQLTSLDVGENTTMKQLFCRYNRLVKLNVSKCTALTNFQCHNNQLSSLDVSQNTKLSYFSCHDNLLTLLDVSNNLSLRNLYCYNNPYLTQIWLKQGKVLNTFQYDYKVATIIYI